MAGWRALTGQIEENLYKMPVTAGMNINKYLYKEEKQI